MQLLGVGLDLCWPQSPPMVGPAGLHELAQRVVALCDETEKTLDGLPAAAEDALIGRRWQDLAEREQALQRRCVELDEREWRWKIAGPGMGCSGWAVGRAERRKDAGGAG